MNSSRRRRALVASVISLASVIGVLAVFSVWVSRQLLETDTWADSSSQLLEDHDIQMAVAGFVTNSLFDGPTVESRLQQALPPRAQPLAGPASGAIRELAQRAALEALQRPQVQQAWEAANRVTQQALLSLVKNGDSSGDVKLDLSAISNQIGSQLGVDLTGKVPPGAAQITILSSSQLGAARSATKLLRPLALVLTIVSLALFGLAIFLAKGRRREAVRACGIAFIAVGLLVLAVRSIAGHAVVDALSSTAAVKPPAQSTWDIGTSLLQAGGAAVVIYGAVIALGSWLAGPGRLAGGSLRELSPLLREPVAAFGGLAVLLLIVFWWDPTPGTSRLVPSLALIVLAVIGVEALRRVARSRFPDETFETASARWSGRFGAITSRRSAPAEAEGGEDESRIGALERLGRLREQGILTAEEFEREKTRVLAVTPQP